MSRKPKTKAKESRARTKARAAQTPRARISRLDLLFIVIILGGGSFLVYDYSSASSPESNSLSNERKRIAYRPPPTPLLEPGDAGVMVANIDLDALRAWAADHELPQPPPLASSEPAVADALTDAYADAAKLRDADSFGTLGMVLESLDCHDSATEAFRTAMRLDPNSFRWPYYLGCIEQVAGRRPEAISLLDRAANLNPDYAVAHARLAQLYLEEGQLDKAESAARAYIQRMPEDSLGFVLLGRLALKRDNPAAAVEQLQKALSYVPHDFQSHYYLSRAYALLGDNERSARHADLCANLPSGRWFYPRDPLDRELHRSGGSVESLSREFKTLSGSRDWDKLVPLAEEIIRRRPQDTAMIGNLASMYRRLERYDDALELTQRALKVRPDSARLYSIRAEIFLSQDEYERVIKEADRSLEHDNRHAPAWGAKGRALFLLERHEEAEAALRNAVDNAPRNAGNLFVLGEALRMQGRNAEAIAVYERVLELQPEFKQARQRISQLRGR